MYELNVPMWALHILLYFSYTRCIKFILFPSFPGEVRGRGTDLTSGEQQAQPQLIKGLYLNEQLNWNDQKMLTSPSAN